MSSTYSTFLLKACPFDPDHQTSDSNTPATMSAKDETEKDSSSPSSPANVQAKEEKKPAPPAAAAAAHQAAGDGRVQGPQPSRWAALKSGPSEGSGRRLSFGKTTTFVNSSIREAEEQRRRHSMGNKEARAKNILRPKLASVGARDAPDGLAKNGTGTGKNAQQGANSGSNKRRVTKGSSTSINSTGEALDYDDEYDLDEPFSDSEDDSRPHAPRKLNLPIPRGRIRTLSGTVPVVGYSPKWGGATMCFSCLQFFDLPSMLPDFISHILKEHHIVVTELDLIVDPKRYVEHWRQRFSNDGGIEKFFPKIIPLEDDALFGQVEYYYLLSEQLPEDYLLRQRLAMRRLEEALSCQQREREDTTFSQQCIFCRYVARVNRSKIIHHLYMIHHLNLGSPDNLVFVNEYVEHLKEKLTRNECIYCEKIFSDRNTLMDHMRKRQHREVNPKNNYYDKFYIINYLELGKKWLDVLAEDFEDNTPTFVDSDEEEEEDSWHEWQEDNLDEDQTRIVCLFCDESFDEAGAMLDHSSKDHGLDLVDLMNDKLKLDVYGRMKLTYNAICYACGKDDLGSWQALRKHQADSEHIAKTIPDRALWDTEENLVPMFGNDHLLWMLESYLDGKNGTDLAAENGVNEEPKCGKSTAKSRLAGQKSMDPVKDAEEATVEGVVAEDLPELVDSALIDKELLESLK